VLNDETFQRLGIRFNFREDIPKYEMGKAPILTVVTELGSDEAYRNTQEDEHGFDH
jgi:hypothetical protein